MAENRADEDCCKISFIGDIMCEKPLLKASKSSAGYQFGDVFKETKRLFSASDYVVGNLETVFAGAKAGYTKELYSFNTPDEFLDALKMSGIDLCVTANNHCLDRGIGGLTRTLDALDQRGISHIGTYRSQKDRDEIYIEKIGDVRIAFLAYTYGTGIKDNRFVLPEDKQYCVNLLIPQKIGSPIQYRSSGSISLKRKVVRHIPEEWLLKLKKKLNRPVGAPRVDELWDELLDETLIDRMINDIKMAKTQADIVVLNIHNGGQFNKSPGKYSEYIMKLCAKEGADVIVGHHPHVVQRFERVHGVPCAYSLGNYSISPSTPYMLFENLPEYSVAFHIYLQNKKIKKLTFSILKIVEDKHGKMSVYDTAELYAKESWRTESLYKDIKTIYLRFTNYQKVDIFKVHAEYEL